MIILLLFDSLVLCGFSGIRIQGGVRWSSFSTSSDYYNVVKVHQPNIILLLYCGPIAQHNGHSFVTPSTPDTQFDCMEAFTVVQNGTLSALAGWHGSAVPQTKDQEENAPSDDDDDDNNNL